MKKKIHGRGHFDLALPLDHRVTQIFQNIQLRKAKKG